MKIFKTLSLTFLFVALGATSASAQQAPPADAPSTVSADLLANTLAEHESAVDQKRAELVEVLARDDVRETAADRGIDLGQVESAAAGLSDAQIDAIAPLVDAIQGGEGGLGTITIGVGLLIVILLVLILVD